MQNTNEKKLMTHIVLNYPNEKVADLVVDTLSKNGSDFVELQIPFSDPIADGSVISNANTASLNEGFELSYAFKKAKFYTGKYGDTKFIFVLYANTINKIGIEEFCKKSKNSGIYGLIVPDLPFDSQEGQETILQCQKNNLLFIPVISPNTPKERLVKLNEMLKPSLIYATAIAGITGSNVDKKSQNPFLQDYTDLLRGVFIEAIVAVGFGIKTSADVKNMKKFADIVVVGSAIVIKITDTWRKPNILKKDLGTLISGFKKTLQ